MPAETPEARVACRLRGDAARIFLDLKRNGPFTTTREIVTAAMLALADVFTERRLKENRLRLVEGGAQRSEEVRG